MRLLASLSLLLVASCFVKFPQFSVLGTLFQQNQIKNTESVQNCFTDLEKQLLSSWINMTLVPSTNYKQLISQIGQFYYALSDQTQGCLKHNNDLNILLYKFGNSVDDIKNSISLYVSDSYHLFHHNIIQIVELFQRKNYISLGKYVNNLGHKLFGNASQNEWIKRVERVQDLSTYYGVSVGNGALGIVSSKVPFRVKDSVLAGAYDKYGRGRVDNIITTFNGINLQLSVNGNDYSHTNFVQQLNMKDGSFRGSLTSSLFSAEYQYFALKPLPFASLIKITITPNSDISLRVTNKLEALDYMHGIQQYFQNLVDGDQILSMMTSKATSSTGKHELFTSTMFLFKQQATAPGIYHIIWDSNMHYIAFQQTIKKGKPFTFAVLSCSLANNLHPDPYNEALRVLIRGFSLGIDKLINKHKVLWNKQWKQADIIIQGNDNDQKDVRMMLYHLYSFINHNSYFGLSPMGLSGTGYNGHVFWDMDLWMYPGILAVDPDLGESLIQYRFQRLDQAMANAYINGYQGAMYPWESASEGTEQTPVWAFTGPLEHHITGCVAFAAWNYYAVTQDKSWLSQKGYKILTKAAQFWQSRVQQSDGVYHINNVVAADEWAQNIDDDAFTNAVAKATLRLANKARKIMGYQPNTQWQNIANKIVILKFKDINVTKEYATYNGGPIKQADVNLLSFPLKQITDEGQSLRDLQYYQNKIPQKGTPAMTYSIFTILYSRLRDADNAYKYFKQSYQPYSLSPFGVFAQTKGGSNPYFLTGAGGVIQSMVYGFGGLDISEEGLIKIQTSIPKQWKSVTIKTKARVITNSGNNTKHVNEVTNSRSSQSTK